MLDGFANCTIASTLLLDICRQAGLALATPEQDSRPLLHAACRVDMPTCRP